MGQYLALTRVSIALKGMKSSGKPSPFAGTYWYTPCTSAPTLRPHTLFVHKLPMMLRRHVACTAANTMAELQEVIMPKQDALSWLYLRTDGRRHAAVQGHVEATQQYSRAEEDLS